MAIDAFGRDRLLLFSVYLCAEDGYSPLHLANDKPEA